jgi:N-acetylmuramoyl-L-alanine amidase
MAICPFAVQQIIPESYTQGRITPTTLIYHRAVSSAESLQNYWTSPGVELESHFHIGQFGTLYQFMDTEVRADANMDANSFAISVESWDGGNTPDDMPWNPAQLATAKRLAAWVCETHGIKRAAAQTWNGGGIGGHNWFPNPWAGGPRGCPGSARNAQIRNDIIPYAAGGGGWRDFEEDDMFTDADRRAQDDLAHRVAALTQMKSKTAGGPSKGEAVLIVTAVDDLAYRVEGIANAREVQSGGPSKGKEIPLVKKVNAIADDVAALKASGTAPAIDYDALADALVRKGVFPTIDAIADEIDRRARDSDHTTGPTS